MYNSHGTILLSMMLTFNIISHIKVLKSDINKHL